MALYDTEIEGTVSGIAADGTGVKMTVNGIDVRFAVSATNKLSTPAGALTITQLLDTSPLPGRASTGFEAGTAIVIGKFDSNTKQLAASEITIEPSENVIVGGITRNDDGPPRQIEVNGVLIALIEDTRLKAAPVRNEFGFDVKPETITIDMPASVEGYFSGGKFHAFVLEVDGPALLVNANPQVSVLRAQGRSRGAEYDLDARGAITTSHATVGQTQRIEIYRVDVVGGVPVENRIGGLQVRVIAGGFSKWRFDERITAGPGFLANPPTMIRTYNSSVTPSAVSADFEVEIRAE
jgi:hypothetical protein